MRRRQDWDDGADHPVPLVDLLKTAEVATPGQLVDLLAERGDAVVVDALGRLAVPSPVAERRRAEHEECERIKREEFERAEAARLERLKAEVELQEQDQARRAQELAIRQRMQRIEQVTGLQTWQLEQAVRKARTDATGSGMSYSDRALEDEKPVTLLEVEEFVAETYGSEVLTEGGNV